MIEHGKEEEIHDKQVLWNYLKLQKELTCNAATHIPSHNSRTGLKSHNPV